MLCRLWLCAVNRSNNKRTSFLIIINPERLQVLKSFAFRARRKFLVDEDNSVFIEFSSSPQRHPKKGGKKSRRCVVRHGEGERRGELDVSFRTST